MMPYLILLLGFLGMGGILGAFCHHAEMKKCEAIREWAAAIRETGFSQEVAAEYMAFLDNC